jgi:hypothetical protein
LPITGTWLLTEALRGHPDDLEAATRQYEVLQRPRAVRARATAAPRRAEAQLAFQPVSNRGHHDAGMTFGMSSTAGRVRVAAASSAIALVAAGLAGCSSGPGAVGKDDVAGQISTKMTDASGSKPDSVTCPDDLKAQVGAEVNCAMKVKGQPFNVNVTVTSVDNDQAKFDMVETVDKDQVASQISDQLAKQVGHTPDKVTCPDNLKGTQGATLRCDLTDQGQTYGVTTTVTDVQGGDVLFDFKVDEQPK